MIVQIKGFPCDIYRHIQSHQEVSIIMKYCSQNKVSLFILPS